jgi:TonB-linked SusC/RagA family outer membrane protein
VSRRAAWARAAFLALTMASPVMAQEQHVTGKVIDADTKQPIPAAQIQVTGTTFAATSGDNGGFSVKVPPGTPSLSVRRIGYRRVTLPLVAGTTEYLVALVKDALQLEQQVITGVATTTSSKNAVTYDPVVTSATLNAVPAMTIENALQGKVPGAVIDQNSGAPGGGMQVSIRGVTTINATAGPLYVIDGIIVANTTFQSGLNALTSAGGPAGQPTSQDQSVNRIADLNPEDIESMQVLEGAAAASIYGARAAGGVILITTKKGTAGKPQIDATQRVGTFNLEHEIPVRRFSLAEAYANGTALSMDSSSVLTNYNQCQGFCDYQKSLYGGGELSYETDLSVRGGWSTSNYFLSGLTKYDNGAEINTGYNKQSFRANFNTTLWSRVTLGATATVMSSLTRRGVDGNDNVGISGYDVISYTPSWFNMAGHTPDGVYVKNPNASNANAYQDANQAKTPEEIERAIVGVNLDWKVFDTEHQALDVDALAGGDFINQHDAFYLPKDTWVEQGPYVSNALRGVSTNGNSFARSSNYSISLIHKVTFTTFNATTSLGLARDKQALYQTNNTGEGLLSGYQNWSSGSTQIPYYQQQETNNQSYYGQEQLLLFDERLAITGGANAMRSSNDGGINRYYIFPKVAGSFRFPNLAPGIVDELKLRAAYGQTGNLPNYGAKFNTVGTTTYDGVVGVTYEGATTAQIAGDKNIRPETNTDYEGGVDLTLFKSRAELSGTVYQKRVTNLLLEETVLPSSGFTNAWTNGGQITNQGLELSLSATPVQAGKFSWITTELFARNYSRVDKSPIGTFTTGSGFGCQFGCNQIKVGSSATALFGYRNGQLVQFGDVAPAFTFSFSQDLSYGPLHAHIMFDWREGQSAVNLTAQYFDAGAFDGRGNNADTALSDKRNAITNAGNSAYIEHASFLKLRELGLKYDLPAGPIGKLTKGFVRYASVSLTGRNLLTWTRYLGADPEVSNFGSQQITRGQDVTPYPPTRSYFFSLDLGL